MQSSEIRKFFHKLSELAAAETLPFFRNPNAIDNKLDAGFDPVTEADRAAELALRNTIMERWPDHGIIGEEFEPHLPDAEYRWIIDPIDGTRAFISGLPLWGTLVALYHGDLPLAGMMAQPFTGEVFVATGGESLLLHRGQGEKLTTAAITTLQDATLLATAPEIFLPDEYAAFTRLGKQCKMTRYGTDCYAYCLVAAGHVDLVCEAGLKFFDIAALIPIIENAGGIVTDWAGNRYPQGGQVLASANVDIHHRALDILNQQ
ncbi:MAG: histidinol-phosphatase [Pseudomonadota bacterium]